MERSILLGLVVLSLTAGCSGFVGVGPAGPTETVTPAPVPTVGPDYPAGVGPNSITAQDVVDAHRRALADASYTLNASLRYGPYDGEYYGDESVRSVGAGGKSVAIVGNRSRHDAFVDWTQYRAFYDGDVTAFQRRDARGRVEKGVFPDGPPSDYGYVSVVETVFATATEWRIRRTADATVVTGTFTRADVMPGPPTRSNVSVGRMRARIDAAGYVERLAVAYEATVGDQRVDVHFSMRVHDVGTTSVPVPEWFVDDPRFPRGE